MNEIISAIIGGGMALALMGILWSRMNGDIQSKVNKEVCEVVHNNLTTSLGRIEDDINVIKTGQEKLTSAVIEVMGQRRQDTEQ